MRNPHYDLWELLIGAPTWCVWYQVGTKNCYAKKLKIRFIFWQFLIEISFVAVEEVMEWFGQTVFCFLIFVGICFRCWTIKGNILRNHGDNCKDYFLNVCLKTVLRGYLCLKTFTLRICRSWYLRYSIFVQNKIEKEFKSLQRKLSSLQDDILHVDEHEIDASDTVEDINTYISKVEKLRTEYRKFTVHLLYFFVFFFVSTVSIAWNIISFLHIIFFARAFLLL